MKIQVHLDPKAPSNLPHEAAPRAAAQLEPMTPGIYTVKLLDWYEGDKRCVSAWHPWGGVYEPQSDPCPPTEEEKPKGKGWLNCFKVARWTGENIDESSKQTIGVWRQWRVFRTAECAFALFPRNEALVRVPVGSGKFVPMLFWLTSDYYNDLGEMRIELDLLVPFAPKTAAPDGQAESCD